MSRWVIVDDTDAGLSYIGPWFQSQGTQNGLGSYGPPLLGSLHGTNSDASFSYSFYGEYNDYSILLNHSRKPKSQ